MCVDVRDEAEMMVRVHRAPVMHIRSPGESHGLLLPLRPLPELRVPAATRCVSAAPAKRLLVVTAVTTGQCLLVFIPAGLGFLKRLMKRGHLPHV